MLRSLLVFAALSSVALAQSSQGPFVGLPLHFAVGPATLGPAGTALSTNELYLKRAGFNDLLPAPPYSPLRPEFTMDAMFGAGRPASFRIDAISSGYHTVFCNWDPGTGDPILTIPAGAWGAMFFSVTKGSPGTGSPAVTGETTRPDGAGADVFSLVLPGSTLPPALASCVPIGVAQRANDSTEMGFQYTPTSKPELGDFDPFFSFYEVEGSLAAYLSPNPWVYFSLHEPPGGFPGPLATMVSSWFNTRSGPALVPPANQPSGATILRTKWVSTPTPHWSQPEVFLAFNELGLVAGDDIDALAVQESGLVCLSLRKTPTRNTLGDQLMVAEFQWHAASPWSYPSCSRTVRTYMYEDGTDAINPLARATGGDGGGDVDAICEIDPSNANGVSGRGFSYVHDCRDGLGLPTPMAASAIPTLSVTPTTTTVAMSVSGVPTSGLVLGALLADARTPSSGPSFNYPVVLDLWVATAPLRTTNWNTAATLSIWGLDLELQFLTVDSVGVISLADVVRLRL